MKVQYPKKEKKIVQYPKVYFKTSMMLFYGITLILKHGMFFFVMIIRNK